MNWMNIIDSTDLKNLQEKKKKKKENEQTANNSESKINFYQKKKDIKIT